MAQDIAPVVNTDGSLASTSDGGRVPYGGFGPSASPTTPLRVVAPLDVTAAPTQALKLAQALGVAQKTIQPVLTKQAEVAGVNQEAKGEAAGATGSIDPQLAATDEAYRLGATRASASKSAIQAIAQLHQKINDPNDPLHSAPLFDSQPGANDGLMSKADAFLQSQLGGLERDPDAAREITPLIEQTMNEIAGRKLAQQAQATQQTAVGNAVAKATADATEGTKVFNYGHEFDTIKSVLGGDGASARLYLDNGLVAQAIATHNPKILDMVAPAPGATTLAPQTMLRITEARQRIAVEQAQDNKVASNAAQLGIMKGILSGHDPRQMLQQYAGMPGADPSFVPRALGFSHSLGEQATQAATDDNGAGITASIAEGRINSAGDLLAAIQATGATGKEASGLLARGMSALSQVQSLDASNPTYKAGISYLQQKYKPKSLVPGMADTASMQQYAGAAIDYRSEVASALKQGKSPEEASNTALQSVEKKWGDPYSVTPQKGGVPRTDADQSAAINQSVTDPQAFLSSGVNPNDIARLRDLGMVSSAQAAAAARLWIQHHTPAQR